MDLLIVILCWALVGLIVGLIARWLVPGGAPLGILRTILVGIAGALLGGLIHRLVFGSWGDPFQLSTSALVSWLFAVLGAVIVLWLYTRWQRKRFWARWW